MRLIKDTNGDMQQNKGGKVMIDVMKVYTAGSKERTRLVAVKDLLNTLTGDSFIIRNVDKNKDTYCRSLDSMHNKDKWTTIMRKKESDTLYHTCLDPWQQERILAGGVNDICEVITEVIGNDGKNA